MDGALAAAPDHLIDYGSHWPRNFEDMKPADDWKARAKANYDIEH
jgi:hypothetical protein